MVNRPRLHRVRLDVLDYFVHAQKGIVGILLEYELEFNVTWDRMCDRKIIVATAVDDNCIAELKQLKQQLHSEEHPESFDGSYCTIEDNCTVLKEI